MAILLVSHGSTPTIVPEAFCSRKPAFQRSSSLSLLVGNGQQMPSVRLFNQRIQDHVSAAIQMAASVLDAKEVFHVWVNSNSEPAPPTEEEIDAAYNNDQLLWVKLGPKKGWPQLRHVSNENFPRDTVSQQDGIRAVRAPNEAFRDARRLGHTLHLIEAPDLC